MKDPAKARAEVISKVLASSSLQLKESISNVEELKDIQQWARTPKERTAVNIILDDQKKVVKALDRLVQDLASITGQ